MKRQFERSVSLMFALVVSIVAGCSVTRPEFEATLASYNSALSSGRIKEALVAYELQAREAEKEANSSSFPRPHWEAATMNYYYASRASRVSGDLQKAIINGERALQTAEKTEEPLYRLHAVQQLIWAYEAVKIFEKSDTFLQRGMEFVKQLPQNSAVRDSWEGILSDELGRSFMRKQEYSNAVEAYLSAIYWNRGWMARLKPNNPSVIAARSNIINILNRLGIAYRRATQFEQAMAQYLQAFASIKEWGLAYPHEDSLHAGVGEVYIQQRRFPEALKSFQKALALAETQRRPAGIRSANLRIAYILRQTGKTKEATAYERRAAEQEKSIHSLLLSPEDREP